jgi:hypothetical protein
MQNIVKFILLLFLEIPAVIVSILIFVYFNSHRVARSKPKNHVWLVLLILNFFQLLINLPMPMSFYYIGRIWPATDAYCVWWTWYEYSITVISLMLMAWASIERHFFIFYPRLLLGAQWKKWAYHFIPILLSFVWPSLWYLALVVISPTCTKTWNFDEVICGVPCYSVTNGGTYKIWELIFNTVIPLLIIIFANLALVTRVIYEKISRHQDVQWHRHRKMAFQLWFISSLYLTGWLPLTLTQLIRITVNSSFFNDQLATIFFLVYLIPLLLPIVCLGVFPEVLNSAREAIGRQRRNRVVATRTLQT